MPMHLRLDDITVLEAGRPVGAKRVRRKGAVVVPGVPRRTFLRTAGGAGMGVGLMALGVFPPARKALAHDGHEIYPDTKSEGPCAPGQYASNDECSPGCSRVPCVNCCIEVDDISLVTGADAQSDSEGPENDSGGSDDEDDALEIVGVLDGDLDAANDASDGGDVAERDDEYTGYHRYDSDGTLEYSWRPNQCWGGTYDGWLWRCSPEILYRCHDGYVTTGDGGTTPTVCRWALS